MPRRRGITAQPGLVGGRTAGLEAADPSLLTMAEVAAPSR